MSSETVPLRERSDGERKAYQQGYDAGAASLAPALERLVRAGEDLSEGQPELVGWPEIVREFEQAQREARRALRVHAVGLPT